MQQTMNTVLLELPNCDMAFLKKLVDKMGWNINKKTVLSEETLNMINRSRQEYKEGKVISFNNASDAQQWLQSL